MSDNKHRETLPLFQWFSAEARYFLAEAEEQETIRIILTEELGEFGEQTILKWELEQ